MEINFKLLISTRQIESEGFMGDVRYYQDPSLHTLMCGNFNMVEDVNLGKAADHVL